MHWGEGGRRKKETRRRKETREEVGEGRESAGRNSGLICNWDRESDIQKQPPKICLHFFVAANDGFMIIKYHLPLKLAYFPTA